MKSILLITKYYAFSLIFGVVAGFYGYAFKSGVPVYINLLFYVFIVWGLVYSHLKASEAKHSQSDFIIIYLGVCFPPILIMIFSPNMLGLQHLTLLQTLGSVLAILVTNFIFFMGIFHASKQVILSAPIEDDYNS